MICFAPWKINMEPQKVVEEKGLPKVHVHVIYIYICIGVRSWNRRRSEVPALLVPLLGHRQQDRRAEYPEHCCRGWSEGI